LVVLGAVAVDVLGVVAVDVLGVVVVGTTVVVEATSAMHSVQNGASPLSAVLWKVSPM
jgi:hypothetical protein